MGNKKRSKN